MRPRASRGPRERRFDRILLRLCNEVARDPEAVLDAVGALQAIARWASRNGRHAAAWAKIASELAGTRTRVSEYFPLE